WQNDSTYSASMVNDADETTRWNAAGGDLNGSWLELDFPAPVVFNRTYISQYDDRITAFKIQAWTGSAWQDLVGSTSNLAASRVDYFPAVTSTKARLFITSATNIPSIYEFGVSYEAPVTNLALAAVATASSFWNNDPTYSADKANDNDLATRWNAHATNGVN